MKLDHFKEPEKDAARGWPLDHLLPGNGYDAFGDVNLPGFFFDSGLQHRDRILGLDPAT